MQINGKNFWGDEKINFENVDACIRNFVFK